MPGERVNNDKPSTLSPTIDHADLSSLIHLRQLLINAIVAKGGADTVSTIAKSPTVELMGRQALYEWTLLQLRQACLLREPLTSYAVFVRGRVQGGPIDLSKEESAHTASFLKSIDVRVIQIVLDQRILCPLASVPRE